MSWILAALIGCGELPRSRVATLPTQLSLLAEAEDGAPLSLLLELRRNPKNQLDVRMTDGAHLYDGRRVWEILPTSSGEIDLGELVEGKRVVLPLAGDVHPELLAIERGTAWFSTTTGNVRCTLRNAACKGTDRAPELHLSYPGPGAGFRVTLSGGIVRVVLPQAPDGLPVFTGVRRLVGVHWVREQRSAAQVALNQTFRGRAIVYATPREVMVDGDLAEWEGASPMVVQDRWQLQSGARGWDGPRDGSFCVAAAWSAGQVCFAGRVRDDVISEGDLVTVRVGERRLSLPLDGPAPAGAAYGSAWFGRTFEACVPAETDAPSLPFLAAFLDDDDDLPPALLASAPDRGGIPLGALRFMAEAPASAPRQR